VQYRQSQSVSRAGVVRPRALRVTPLIGWPALPIARDTRVLRVASPASQLQLRREERMTGAQERELGRLRKKHSDLQVNAVGRSFVRCSFTERTPLGEKRQVKVSILPDGRVER
jgi:hypothetical protein